MSGTAQVCIDYRISRTPLVTDEGKTIWLVGGSVNLRKFCHSCLCLFIGQMQWKWLLKHIKSEGWYERKEIPEIELSSFESQSRRSLSILPFSGDFWDGFPAFLKMLMALFSPHTHLDDRYEPKRWHLSLCMEFLEPITTGLRVMQIRQALMW